MIGLKAIRAINIDDRESSFAFQSAIRLVDRNGVRATEDRWSVSNAGDGDDSRGGGKPSFTVADGVLKRVGVGFAGTLELKLAIGVVL